MAGAKMYEFRKTCRSCGNAFVGESLLRLSNMPGSVQNLPCDRDQALASGIILDVRQCSFCGLVQLSNEPVPYYKDVIRAGSVSPSMRARQHDAFKAFIERFSLQEKTVLEIGSGRGEYLSILSELPVQAFGMEHNAELCRMANKAGLRTFNTYPTDVTGPLNGIVFDAFVCINFLEHAPDPAAFLLSCARLLNDSGIGMIGVPDFEFELKDNYLFSFMSDHLSYFSCDSLLNLLSLQGFEVMDLFKNKDLNVVTAYIRRRKPCNLSAPREKFNEINEQINDYVDTIHQNGGRVALWGASHLAFSIVSASQTETKIAYLVDSAPFKQGRFSPATGLEIFPPGHLVEDPVDAVMVMSPEYSAEIVSAIRENYSKVVRHIATFQYGGLEIVQ